LGPYPLNVERPLSSSLPALLRWLGLRVDQGYVGDTTLDGILNGILKDIASASSDALRHLEFIHLELENRDFFRPSQDVVDVLRARKITLRRIQAGRADLVLNI
jgi:hypothetical protein